MENELYHYGRKGMKWYQNIFSKDKGSNKSSGKKNGKKEETAEERKARIEAKKKEVLNSRSAKALYDNAQLFTTQELQAAYGRLQLERNIKNLQPTETSKGKQFVEKAIDLGKLTTKALETGRDLYNETAKLYNTFSKSGREKPLPIIKDNDNQNKPSKGEKGNDNQNKSSKGKKNKGDREAKRERDEIKNDFKDAVNTAKAAAKKAKEARSQTKSDTEEYDLSWLFGDSKTSSQSKAGKDYIDAEWWDVDVSSATSQQYELSGRNYVAGLLEAPKDRG